MRLVLLVAHSPEGEIQHRYVANKLAEEFPGELAAIIIATGSKKSILKKCKRWWQRYTLMQICSRIAVHLERRLHGRDRSRQDTYRSILFPDGDGGQMPRRDILHWVPSHNGPKCAKLLDKLKADIVIVYGTLIISRSVISSSKMILNLHTGLSPIYRGSDTIFWPLHNSEPDKVGVTVHQLDVGVDSGPILARGRPLIESGDNEDSLFAKCVQLGAELLCRAVRREAGGRSQPIRQHLNSGREYRSVERTLAAERRTRKLLNSGLLSRGHSAWSEEF